MHWYWLTILNGFIHFDTTLPSVALHFHSVKVNKRWLAVDSLTGPSLSGIPTYVSWKVKVAVPVKRFEYNVPSGIYGIL